MSATTWAGDAPVAIVFDFDGVILESAAIKSAAFVELFADRPEHQAAILRHHEANLGISRFTKFEWIYRHRLGLPLDDAERQRLGDAFQRLVLDKMLSCPMVPGAREALDALPAGMPAFVASGTPHDELQAIVSRRDLGRYFVEVRGTPPEKTRILQELLEAHRLEPAQVLMVGDGLTDYEAAAAAGTRFVARQAAGAPAVAWPPGTAQIDDLTPLAELLAAQS